MDKDWRLVEAALASDKTVASLDETMCDYLKDIGQQVIQLQTICWLNPDTHREVIFNWLENGARERDEAQFYLRPPQS